MNKIQKLKIAFVILAIILVSVILMVGIRTFYTPIIESKKEEQKLEEIYNSTPEKNKRNATEFVLDICDAINKENFGFVYNSLDDIYKECMFDNDIDKMKSFLKNDLKLTDNYEAIKATKTANLYHVLVGIESGEKYYSRYFTVKDENENTYKFMFDEYILVKREDKKNVGENIDYTVKYVLERPEAYVYVCDVTNKNSKVKNISFDGISATTSNGKLILGSKQENIEFTSDNTVERIQIMFNKKEISNISFIELKIHENEIEKNVKIFFDNGIM